MAKGGARANSGPPRDPNALRREQSSRDGEWTNLPAAGRSGSVPQWPLAEASVREIDLWEAEWRRPQAIEWERNGQELEVALYVRSLVAAESLEASVAARTLVRQQQEALGLSLPGLRLHRFRIVAEETPAKPTAKRQSARERLRIVSGGE